MRLTTGRLTFPNLCLCGIYTASQVSICTYMYIYLNVYISRAKNVDVPSHKCVRSKALLYPLIPQFHNCNNLMAYLVELRIENMVSMAKPWFI